MTAPEHNGNVSAASIAIIDGLPLFRAGVAHALNSQSGIEVVEQGETGMEALQIAGKRPIDIMLVDLNVPGGGMPMLTSLTQSWPLIKLVVLTASEHEEDVVGALRCGARGYVLKRVKEHELVTALRAVSMGDVYLTPSLGARLFAQFPASAGTAPHTSTFANLTPRETEILKHVSLGETNKEIAVSLRITEKTVKYYMTIIMQKLQVRNRVEAVFILREKTRLSA